MINKINAIVLGNGRSREGMDLEVIHKYGTMYGCNALYRDYTPDFLICTDRRMCVEVSESGYADEHVVYFRNQKTLKFINARVRQIYCDPQHGSGPTAAFLAARDKFKNVFLVGHDLMGGSIYDGTPNYNMPGLKDIRADEYRVWTIQLGKVFGEFIHTNFFMVQPWGHRKPEEWRCYKNLKYISPEDFIGTLTKHLKVVILGNGESRRDLDLEAIHQYAMIYGCNGLYRDYTPDILFCVDPKMVKEIDREGYAKEHVVYTRNTKHCSYVRVIDKDPGWSCGPTATLFACRQGFKKIYLIGHDLLGISGYINNMYKGTENYAPTSARPTYYGNWAKQLLECFTQYPDASFVRNNFGKPPPEWKDVPNLRHIFLQNLTGELKDAEDF